MNLSVQHSDLCGFLSALLLLVSPAKDLISRWRNRDAYRGPSDPVATLGKRLSAALLRKGAEFSGVDALSWFGGAVLLAMSFALKAFGQ